jgi:hypothetical protein
MKKRVKKTTKITIVVAMGIIMIAAMLLTPATSEASGITVYRDDASSKYVKLGGRLQLQYHRENPDVGGTTDETSFRRLRPYIEAGINEDWTGKFQWDMGGAEDDNELAVKDAYMRYKGLPDINITIGNADFAFSREFLTSSKYQQLVERTFVGDHNYGTPDKNLGLHITGSRSDKKITYGVSIASASIDPDSSKLDFDTPVNRDTDFNEGYIYGGRVDFHPLGNLKFSQGDFSGETLATIGVAAFVWKNDEDNNTYTLLGSDTSGGNTPDVDEVTGLEISGAIRSKGVSIDVQYNRFSAETVDSNITAGIYRSGDTTLKSLAIEGGYMIIPDKLELVAALESQDADNYSAKWKRNSIGANYFIEGHDIKAQITYRESENVDGVRHNADSEELFVQMQYVF